MKNLKKLISVMLTISMLISTMSACVISASADVNTTDAGIYEIVQDIDFENLTVDGTNWLDRTATDHCYVDPTGTQEAYYFVQNKANGTSGFVGAATDPEDADNTVVMIEADSGADLWFKTYHDGDTWDNVALKTRDNMQGKKLVYSAKVYIPSDATLGNSKLFGTWDRKGNSNQYMTVNGNNFYPYTMKRGNQTGEAKSNIGTIKGKWVELKYVIDYSEPLSTTHSDTIRVYVDNQLIQALRTEAFNSDPNGIYDFLSYSTNSDHLPAETDTTVATQPYFGNGESGYTAGHFRGVGFNIAGGTNSVVYVDDVKAYLVDPLTYTPSANFTNYTGGTISLTFNQQIREEDVVRVRQIVTGAVQTTTHTLASLFTLKTAAGAAVTGGIESVKLEDDGKTVTIKPKADIAAGDYKLAIDSFFIDVHGQGLNSNNTAREIDLTVGEIQPFKCVLGDEDVADYDIGTFKEITLEFNYDLDDYLNDGTIHEAFKVLDKNDNEIPNLGVELVDRKTVKLQLKDLRVGLGDLRIVSNPEKLRDIFGASADLEIVIDVNQFEANADPISNYMPGEPQTIELTLSADVNIEIGTDISSLFKVTDDERQLDGLKATLVDARTVQLELKDLEVGKGNYKIEARETFVDATGRQLDFDYTVNVLPFEVETASPSSGEITDYVEGTSQEVTLTLSAAVRSGINIADCFVVSDESGNECQVQLNPVLSNENKTVTFDLQTLTLGKGQHKIKATLVDEAGRQLKYEYIFTAAETGSAGETTSGVIGSSGSNLPEGAGFETLNLLDENFDSYQDIIDADWLTDTSKRPEKFIVKDTATGYYSDASVSITNDPADPESGNLVLKNVSGYRGLDGLPAVIDSTHQVILQRNLDNGGRHTSAVNDYTEVSVTTKIYIEQEAAKNLPKSATFNKRYSDAFAIVGGTDFATYGGQNIKTALIYNGSNPAKHIFSPGSDNVSTGRNIDVTAPFTANEWHTIEIIYTLYPKPDGTPYMESYKMFLDGKNIEKDYDSAFHGDYATIGGIMSQIITDDGATGSAVVYYDDWSIVQRTRFKTHINIPEVDVVENPDNGNGITLTLTKEFDDESYNALKENNLVTIKDKQGNTVESTINFVENDKIVIVPKYGLKYQTGYVIKIPSTYTKYGYDMPIKSKDNEKFDGLTYVFNTAKGPSVTIDESASTFSCNADRIKDATEFNYNLQLSGSHTGNIIAAVATFDENGGVLGIKYETIAQGTLSKAFTLPSATGAKSFKVYIWEENNGSIGRLLQLPYEINGR